MSRWHDTPLACFVCGQPMSRATEELWECHPCEVELRLCDYRSQAPESEFMDHSRVHVPCP